MKKIMLLGLLFVSTLMFAQEVKEPSKITYYASAGLSLSNAAALDADGNEYGFAKASYPSLEFGACKDNLSLGVVVGRGNLADFKHDVIQNYWYELKTAVSAPMGVANGYLLFGAGNYVGQDHFFIEYGAGVSYTPSKVGYFVQASNWDGIWYVTPGLTYNF